MTEYDNKNNLINMQNNIQNTQNYQDMNNNCKNMINYKQNAPLQQNYNNRYYNNFNNNLINQNNINIINNNIDYNNSKNKISPRAYINNNINIHIKPISTKVKCTCSKTGCKKKYCACFSKNKYCIDCECKDCENKPPNKENLINISNNAIKQDNVEKINYSKVEIPNQTTQRIICNCTKSNCMKKYCECYKQGLNCNSLCRCIECKNKNYINDTNNFYNYALNGNISNNNINNNLSQVHDFSTSYFPETFGKSIDYNNPINFQTEAFGIYIKKDKLQIERRKISLSDINNNNILNKNNENNIIEKEVLNYNYKDLNETPKFSEKKRLRSKNENSAGIKTCPTTNSLNRRKKGVSVVNKNIKKKRLQLS